MFPDSFFQSRIDDRREKLLVLRHLIRREHILRPVAELISKIEYFGATDPDLEFLFRVVHSYWNEFGSLPSCDVLLMEMDAANQLTDTPFPQHYMDNYRAVLKQWYAENDWGDDYVKMLLQQSIQLSAVDSMMSQVASNDDIDELQKHISSAGRQLQGNLFESLSEETAWDDIQGNIQEAVRSPLGLQFLDEVLDGGLGLREAMLLIAPSGGGKTTLGLQIAAYQVSKGVHVMYYSTEQPLKGDMSIRQYVLGAEAQRSDFTKGFKNIPPDVLQRLEESKVRWKKYLHFVDCRKSKGNIKRVEDIFEPMDRVIEQGNRPGLVIVDWWGRLRSRLIMQQGHMSDARSRHATSEWLDSLLDGVKARDSRILVLHQVAGAAAKKGAKALLTTHDAQEDSNLNNLFEFGFAMSKLDSDCRVRINCDKARSSARTEGQLQLIGQECKFQTISPELDLAAIPDQGMVLDDLLTTDDYLRGGAE